RAGDQVYGFLLHANPTAHAGAWAELITSGEEFQIASAPDGVDLAIAGAAPLAGITALMSVDALDLHDGDVVLIVGATGGVGRLAHRGRRRRAGSHHDHGRSDARKPPAPRRAPR